ncbi:MAG: hypothetical protein FWC09_01845 [Lachnospiraceae bacterium]|nr:hypothetical protein [Lachnospiraceae bacterium]
MKKIKYISAVILIILGIVLIGEIHSQQFFRNRDSLYTYTAYDFGEDHREAAEDIRSFAERNNIIAFIIDNEFSSELEHNYGIYSTSELPQQVINKFGRGNNLKSIIFGNINITFNDIKEAPINNNGFLRFYGQRSDITVFITEFDELYNRVIPIHEPNPDTLYRNVLIGYWSIIFAYILFLTLVEIFLLKKECFIRTILGASVASIIWRNIIIDIAVYLITFLSGILIFMRLTSVSNELALIFLLLVILIITNSLLYLFLYKIDYKSAMSNSKIPKKILKSGYLIKSFAAFFAIFAISSSLMLMKPAVKYFQAYDFFASKKTYDFADFQFRTNHRISEDMMLMTLLNQANTEMNNAIYIDYFERLKPIVLQNIFSPTDDDGLPYDFGIIKANLNAFDYLSTVIKGFSADAVTTEVVFLIPNKEGDKDRALDFAKLFIHDEVDYSVYYYDSGVDVICINGGDFLLNEFAFHHDPVIIFDAVHPNESSIERIIYRRSWNVQS